MSNLPSIPALVMSDFYKTDHRRQFPDGTTTVYSNFTPRGSRLGNVDHVVFFGLQYFCIEYLQKRFTETFFALPKQVAVEAYRRRLDNSLGKDSVPIEHIAALHELGYLPLRIKALPEGARVPMQVPTHTIENTDPRFAWLTNFIETLMSCTVWGPTTSATMAFQYRQVFEAYAARTGAPRAVARGRPCRRTWACAPDHRRCRATAPRPGSRRGDRRATRRPGAPGRTARGVRPRRRRRT